MTMSSDHRVIDGAMAAQYLATVRELLESPALLETDLNQDLQSSLFKLITRLVHAAEKEKHGCTLVLDLNSEPVQIML